MPCHVLRLGACSHHCRNSLVPDLCESITLVFDSALQSQLKRIPQRSELFYDSQTQSDLPKETNLDCLLEWFVTTGCCAYDIQKSLRWVRPHHFCTTFSV